jgi:hypothetical protein
MLTLRIMKIGDMYLRKRELEALPSLAPDQQEELTRIISILGSDIDLKTFRDDLGAPPNKKYIQNDFKDGLIIQ